jgi:hypothetical protein
MMYFARARTVLTVATAGLLLAGCGPAKASPPATAPPPAASATDPVSTAAAVTGGGLTACDLVTEQQASAAMGTATGPGTSGGTAALSECIYATGSLIISMKTDAKTIYDKSHHDAIAKGAADVPGVGDSAFAGAGGGADHCILEFLKGTTLVNILLSGAGGCDAAVTLAKAADSKL